MDGGPILSRLRSRAASINASSRETTNRKVRGLTNCPSFIELAERTPARGRTLLVYV